MKEEIIKNLDNPLHLEKMYRDNKTDFKRAFNLVYLDIKEIPIAQIWNLRLNSDNKEISLGKSKELIFIIVASVLAGIISKIPEFTAIKEVYFYPRNFSFIFIPWLTVYFAWRQQIQFKKLVIVSAAILFAVFFINYLPDNTKSDTLFLACSHLPIFLWAVLGYTFVGDNSKNHHKRLDFLRYNGDLVIMTTIILIGGMFLTGITLGLFSLIDLRIEKFYFRYIVVGGLAASPIVGTYLIQTNPQIVNKVSPALAKLFTPLVLLTLVVFLFVVVRTAPNLHSDRDFLLIFNNLLIGVMAIVLFSIAETSKRPFGKFGIWLLYGLVIVTIIVNCIALLAIYVRISQLGITPNRLAVIGGNILILTNLLMVTYHLHKTINDSNNKENVEKSIASFLPVYGIWSIIVTFIFPILFNFK